VKKVLDKLAALVDPRGPLGEVLSPADVFKERAGLPVSTPHVARDSGFTQTEIALAPTYFVAAQNVDVPKSRVRQVSRYVDEHFSPVYDTANTSNFAEAIRASKTLVGWHVTQKARSPHCDCLQATLELEGGTLVHRACGRARKRVDDADFAEHILSLSIAPSDEFYNMYYPTIPGNDPVIQQDGSVLKGEAVYKNGKMVHDGTIRGGTMIRGGRRQYRSLTKTMVHWDKGHIKERARAYEEHQKGLLKRVRPMVEKANKERLPRNLGNL